MTNLRFSAIMRHLKSKDLGVDWCKFHSENLKDIKEVESWLSVLGSVKETRAHLCNHRAKKSAYHLDRRECATLYCNL